jgi:hypothetical protein
MATNLIVRKVEPDVVKALKEQAVRNAAAAPRPSIARFWRLLCDGRGSAHCMRCWRPCPMLAKTRISLRPASDHVSG